MEGRGSATDSYIIILNGDKPKFCGKEFFSGKRVVCADGAYGYFAQFGLRAFAVVGDMDSYSGGQINALHVVKFPRDKDKTDGQLAIEFAAESGAREVVIIGAAGQRDDHYLANIGLLSLAHKMGIEARIVTDYSEIHFFKEEIELTCSKNKYFSIVPFSQSLHIIGTEGLKYEICRKTLKSCDSLGISNETVAQRVKITAKRGAGLAILSFEDVKKTEVLEK